MDRRRTAAVATAALLAAAACAQGKPSAQTTPSPSESSLDPTAPRLVVQMVTPSVRAGEYAEAIVRFENLRSEGVLDVTFGDNGPGSSVASADTGCGTQPGFVEESRVKHPYRYAGTWTVTATFLSAPCGQDERREYRGTATVEVTPADVPGNGPERPRMTQIGDNPHARAATGMTRMQGSISDSDGYLTEIRYAWGDGSPATVFTFPLDKCVDPHDHWPMSSKPASENDPEWRDPEHRYPRPGEYQVTVTAVSTGCDGGARQEATHTVTVTAR